MTDAVLGDLQGPSGRLDTRGRVEVVDGSWVLEWGAGAADRWHIAHREAAVRQHRIDDAPVYATWMRVPGGDVIQRVAATSDGDSRALVVDFENASPEPLAVALAATVPGGGRAGGDVELLALDGVGWIRGDRPAGAVVATEGDPWAVITDDPEGSSATVQGRGPVAVGAVFAVPHRQRVSVAVALVGDLPSRLPAPEQVAAGWRRVTADALTIDVPDPDLSEAWRRILPDLIVQAGADDRVAAAEAAPFLELAGLRREADRARAGLLGVVTLDSWPLRPASPAAVAATRVIDRVFVPTRDGLDVLPDVPESWRGGPVDVRNLVTPHGRLSFSVRWHGDRPALLWERTSGPDEVVIRCPGLDPGWSATERSGEMLLAAGV